MIAGEFGGRRLRAPRGRSTRPTADRVKEAMFMALEPLAGLEVADLFAGSGSLGIEALSRGARHVHFVESSEAALAALRQNLETLGLCGRSTVWRGRWPAVLRAMGRALGACPLVLADPPYGGDEAREVLRRLGRPGVLREGARLVLEHHAKDALPERDGRLHLTRSRRYGETGVTWYEARSPERLASEDEEDGS